MTNTGASVTQRSRRHVTSFTIAASVLIAIGVLGLVVGPLPLSLGEVWDGLKGHGSPLNQLIIRDVRLPRTITAILVGGALGVSGLMMQTLFRNPLADPQVLGVSSGASFGVAVVVLFVGSSPARTQALTSGLGLSSNVLITVAAAIGAAVVMGLVLLAGRWLKSAATLLLLGVMVGYLVSSGVTIMLAAAAPELVQQFTLWGFGSYRGVTWDSLRILAPIVALATFGALSLAKPLNAFLLGERYAQTMGVNVRRVRALIIVVTALLTGVSTAFCGPIAFLGIAIPHLCRGLFGSSNHRILIPACLLVGSSLALFADICSQLPGENVLPLNAVNAAFGAPVVIFVLIHHHKRLMS
ncbi:MAG: FecCD family ABC transporter permease [Propionibacteriaceae bacterium]